MNLILSILMLAGIGMLGGAIVLARRGRRKHAALMAIAALVMFGNVALLAVPLSDGRVPADASIE